MKTLTTHYPRSCQSDNGCPESFNETINTPISKDGRPEHGKTYTLPARQGVAVRLYKGETLRIINTHGTQVCDLWFFNSADTSEFFSSEHLRGTTHKVNPQVNDVLLSNRRQEIATFITDTSPGVHDTLIAACDPARYRLLGYDGYHDNCSDNLRQALMAIGMRCNEIPQPFNVWMNIPINNEQDIAFLPCASKAGDYVEFKMHMDCIAVMSACPMDLSAINSHSPLELAFSTHQD